MSEIIIKNFKKSNVNAKNDFDFYQLKRNSDCLLNCEIERTIDEVTFTFALNEEQPFTEIRNLTFAYRYQLLINIANLYTDISRLEIGIEPSNLFFDINMMPKAMVRDVYENEKFHEENFVQAYTSLIGYALQNKYSFSDFYEGGNQLLLKNKATALFVDVNCVQDIVTTLHKEYKVLQEKLQFSIIEVDKKKYRNLKIISRSTLLFLVLAIGLGGYFGFYRLSEESIFNKANEFYIKQDYVSVIHSLNNINITRMNTNTKYVLAVSNIKSESLTDKQKNNILSSVSLNSDVRILEFWIALGQKNTEKAIDIAKQLGNKEYLAYAYMKEKANVENDKDLSGSEREQKLKEIEENLKNMNINQTKESKNNE